MSLADTAEAADAFSSSMVLGATAQIYLGIHSHHLELLLLPSGVGFQHQSKWTPVVLSLHWMLLWQMPSSWGPSGLPALACFLHLFLACLLLHIRLWLSQGFPNQAQLGFDVLRENTIF